MSASLLFRCSVNKRLIFSVVLPFEYAPVSWRVSILKDNGMFQTNCIVCIKHQSQSQLIVRSAVITSVMSVSGDYQCDVSLVVQRDEW